MISELAVKYWEWIENMGWHNKTVLETMALIASEVGEAINECRGVEPTEAFGEKLADIALRVMDLSVCRNIDLEAEIVRKMEINRLRGTRGRRI